MFRFAKAKVKRDLNPDGLTSGSWRTSLVKSTADFGKTTAVATDPREDLLDNSRLFWSPEAVWHVLQNSAYKGQAPYGKTHMMRGGRTPGCGQHVDTRRNRGGPVDGFCQAENWPC